MLRVQANLKASLATMLMLLTIMVSMPAFAQSFPELTGRVVDQADLLSDAEEAALSSKLETLEKNSTRQLVVTTITDLQGYDIADYGYQLGRHWGIGQAENGDAEKDNGVLLIIAPNQRRMRIEVGYGLEPILTDGLSSQIIRNDITPQFKAGNFPGGINAGVDRIITQLTLPPEQARQIAQQTTRRDDNGVDAGMIIFWLFILFFFVIPMLRGIFGGKKHRKRGYSGPVIIWGGGSDWGSGGSSWGGGGGFGGGGFGGGFGGGGGGFGGGGASGGW